jgi:hypothetical protein
MGSHEYAVRVDAQGSGARPAWREMVEQGSAVALSKTPEWVDCICETDRFVDACLLFRGDDGRRIILPRVGIPGIPGFFASPPVHWNLGADASGFLTEGGPLEARQVQALVREVRRLAGFCTRIVVGRDDARSWQLAVPSAVHPAIRTSHVIDLQPGFSVIWSNQFNSKVRSNCRKAERRGVVIESDNTGRLIAVFYSLFRKSVDRWARDSGYPVNLMRWRYSRSHPEIKFETIARRLRERCTVWMAWQSEKPLAGIVVLTRRVIHKC